MNASAGGWHFVILVALMAAGYTGGGVAWGWRVRGKKGRPSLQLHPHFPRWLEVAALFEDGVAFSRSHAHRSKASPDIGRRSRGAGGDDTMEAAEQQVKKSKSTKTKTKTKHSKTPHDANEPLVEKETGSTSPRVPPVDTAPAVGTPAGGGGRWVHVT